MRDWILDDTSADALAVQLKILRRIGMEGRAAMTFELSDNLRQIVRDGVRHHHPDWNEGQIKQEVLRIVLGDHLYKAAFGESRSFDE